jgi:hypothetical protein
MRILVACEVSGRVRDALRAKGHDAWSCDLLPCLSSPEWHIQGDALEALASQQWDMLIAFPPCTYLCVSGQHWNHRRPERQALTEQAATFFMAFANANVSRIAIENPIGIMSTRWRKPDQTIQPYQFGDDASKKTCLWLKGLPRLEPTSLIPGRTVTLDGKLVTRWSNQTDSGQNRLGPSKDRAFIRSLTYPGIAQAMADQWGGQAGVRSPSQFDQ